ncbi:MULTISPECIES: hypothetical protein [unclassified Novosphingobium]|jgi:hypothetical protein|nr:MULTISPECIES: hypothetical protein [unclassified Novosphingobium]|tara:strand:- start:2912 stop:3163 length:252 start_codon:yes stop_codon:yes gene_type:complete
MSLPPYASQSAERQSNAATTHFLRKCSAQDLPQEGELRLIGREFGGTLRIDVGCEEEGTICLPGAVGISGRIAKLGSSAARSL